MKPITTVEKVLLLAAVLMGSQIVSAQENSEPTGQQKYRISVVKEENGNKEVIDRTFDNKEDLTAFVKENNLEAPEAPGEATQEEVIVKKTKGGEEKAPKAQADKKEKKIIIIEKEEGSTKESGDFEIILRGLTPDERINVTQELINMNLGKVEIVHPGKDGSWNNAPAAPGNNAPGSTLGEVKVFPNPGQGQFHVQYDLAKPGSIKLRITDLQGNEVYAEAFNSAAGKCEKDVNSTRLAKGTYLLSVEAGSENKTTQVVMQ